MSPRARNALQAVYRKLDETGVARRSCAKSSATLRSPREFRGLWPRPMEKIAMNRFLRDNTDTRVMFQTAS
jgi:hypothetical protein